MKFLIRCESGPAVGVGHAMRCSTLALVLAERGHEVVVRTGPLARLVSERLRHRRIAYEVCIDGAPFNRSDAKADLIVIDGYGLASYAREAHAAGSRLAMLDDNAELPVELAEVVVNQNLHAEDVDYSAVVGSLLTGTRYALIRSEVTAIERHRPAPAPLDLLISMGGTDPAGLTLPLVRQVSTIDRSIIGVTHIAVAERHRDEEALRSLIAGSDRLETADSDLTQAMRRVGLAVIGGGSTLWELATLGIPAIAAIVADNQVAGSRAAEASGCAETVDARAAGDDRNEAVGELARTAFRLAGSLECRTVMSANGPGVVDGLGAHRVADAIVVAASR